MERIKEINRLFEQLQAESTNSGGQYHFTKIDMIDTGTIADRLKNYMRRFKQYQDPYYYNVGNEKVYQHGYDPENLELKAINNFELFLTDKLHYWSTHKTSLDCRENITEFYGPLEKEFKDKLYAFLCEEEILGVYEIHSVNTYYCFGYDHYNDDTLIHTKLGYYILHFGWSS